MPKKELKHQQLILKKYYNVAVLSTLLGSSALAIAGCSDTEGPKGKTKAELELLEKQQAVEKHWKETIAKIEGMKTGDEII